MYVGHKVTELQIVWSLCHLIKSGPWIMSPVCWCRSKVTCCIELDLKANSWTIFYWALGNIICLSQRQRQIKCINHKSGINWKSVSAQIVDFGTVLQGVSVARQVCACVWGVQLSGINEPALGEELLKWRIFPPLFCIFNKNDLWFNITIWLISDHDHYLRRRHNKRSWFEVCNFCSSFRWTSFFFVHLIYW